MVEQKNAPNPITLEAQQMTPLPVPRNKRGGIRWALLRNNLELIQVVIEAEASSFLAETGELNSSALRTAGRHNLVDGIFKYYPGKIAVLEDKLCPSNPKVENTPPKRVYRSVGYWTQETIKKQALEFYITYGGLSHRLLIENGLSALSNAVMKQYPGKWRQLKHDLGLENRKPKGFWTNEAIEIEATNFANEYGRLNFDLLQKYKQNTLSIYILRKYPGGIVALREKLGISIIKEEIIPVEQANQQLRKLLEE